LGNFRGNWALVPTLEINLRMNECALDTFEKVFNESRNKECDLESLDSFNITKTHFLSTVASECHFWKRFSSEGPFRDDCFGNLPY